MTRATYESAVAWIVLNRGGGNAYPRARQRHHAGRRLEGRADGRAYVPQARRTRSPPT